MSKIIFDPKASRGTLQSRISAQAGNPPSKNSRYSRVPDEDKPNTSSDSKPRDSFKRIRITTSNHNLRHAAAERPNLKSLQLKDSTIPQPKSTSPYSNYNQIKMKRLLRQQKRTHQIKKTESQTLEPLAIRRQKNTESVQNLNHTLLELVEEGCVSEHLIKDSISQLEKMLVLMNQKQNTERKGANQQASTVKKGGDTTRKEDSFRKPYKFLIKPEVSRKTIEYEDDASSLKKLDKASEGSLTDTQHIRHYSSKQIHNNLLSLIINKTKQQRKGLNLKDVRDQYKQEASANKSKIGQQQTTKKTNSQKKQSSQHTKSSKSRKFLHPALLLQPSRTIEAVCHHQHTLDPNTVIEQQDSKIQVSNFSSPLQLPKGKQQSVKLNLDISIINKQQHESIDSTSNRQFLDLAGQVRLQDKKKPVNRKKKIVDIQKFKKNFPLGFFDG